MNATMPPDPHSTAPEDVLASLALLEQGRATLAAQPFSELLGTRLANLQPGRAELRLAVTRQLLQQSGLVHGGVLAYLADNAITFAAGSLLGPGVVTAGVEIHYLRAARGRELVATATVIHPGRSLAVCRCDIVAVGGDGQSVLCAAAMGSVSRARTDPSP